MEQGTNHMLEVPVEKAAVSRRFLKWVSCSWFCPHDELPFAVSWFQDIYKGGPIGKWYRPFARRTVGRGKGVRASRIESSQELLPSASTVVMPSVWTRGDRIQNNSHILGVCSFRSPSQYSGTSIHIFAEHGWLQLYMVLVKRRVQLSTVDATADSHLAWNLFETCEPLATASLTDDRQCWTSVAFQDFSTL